MKLKYFNKLSFIQALKALFNDLNVPINYVTDDPTTAKGILEYAYKDNETFALIEDVYFVGMVDDAAFKGEKSIDKASIKKDYDGVLVFGITLKQRENGLLPTRSQLAEISRAFNREYYYTPVTVVFKYSDGKTDYLAFANTERLAYKQNWREGDKAGKVALLRDVNIENPHRGHEDIIYELKIQTSENNKIDSFDKLYKYWQEVFNVNVLNKKFYQELSNWYFWAIKHVTFPSEPTMEDIVKAHGVSDTKKLDEAIQEHKAKNVIRLLTRLLFTWFIKEKGLVPEQLFDLKALQEDILKDISPYHEEGTMFAEANKESVYYKAILQNLFFASLNCPIEADGEDKRSRGFRGDAYGQNRGIDYLMRYKEHFKDPDKFLELMNSTVPFLNGGLFECLDDKTKNEYIDGFSDGMTKGERLVIPDYLFFGVEEEVDLSAEYGEDSAGKKHSEVKGLINILKSYKFTIAENTPIEEDVALDPELLGKVFENLLASYNPETKTTARKQTGSFYTPREIVNYMVDESLIAYLKNSLKETGIMEEELDDQFHELASFDPVNPFQEDQKLTRIIIEALSNCKILDPACGSGAFPMGILQKMVHILQKLDPENKIWKEVQLEKAMQETEEAFTINDKEERGQRLEEINNAFDEKVNDPDYARKLFLIENCIYGVDIQPIATQISKLRFFIALVVDQKVNQGKNFGVRPLPNLETKFVTANTLVGIDKPGDQISMFTTDRVRELEKELKSIRHLLFSAKTKSTKLKYRIEDERIRNEIAEELIKNGWQNESAELLANWDPYDQNASSPFFDPEWMFDTSNGFSILIGNPPYIDSEGMIASGNEWLRELISNTYKLTKGNWDIYIAFFEKSFSLLDELGILSFITPDKWLTKPFGTELRKYSLPFLLQLLRSGRDVFESAGVDSIVTVFNKEASKYFDYLDMVDGEIKKVSSIDKGIFQSPYQLDIVFSPYIKLLIDITNFHSSMKDTFTLECENACATSDCYILKEILENLEDVPKDVLRYQVINTGTIGRYVSRWGKKEMTYLKDKYLHPIVRYDSFHETFTNSYSTKAKSPKIIIKGLTLLDSTIDYNGSIIPGKSTLIIKSSDNNQLKVLAAIINSKVASFYIKQRYSASSYNTGVNFTKDMINNLPIPVIDDNNRYIIEFLVDMICFTDDLKNIEFLDYFIDAFVLNLYFEELMKALKIDIIDHIEQDIYHEVQGRNFDRLNDMEKEKVIEQLATTWSDQNNEVVKRMAQFKEKSPDILKPILES